MSPNNYKYPRTSHLTFSPGGTSDDKKLDSNSYLINKEIIISSKLDGSNFCFTNKECFARSHSGPPKHKSFDMAKSIHYQIKTSIPNDLFIYSEYLFAKHSIYYTQLPSYLFIFNILDIKQNIWLSWDDIEKISTQFDIPTVPVLFRGKFLKEIELENMINMLSSQKEFNIDEREGVVVRAANSITAENFSTSCAKWVRAGHVTTDDHWRFKEIVRNKLALGS